MPNRKTEFSFEEWKTKGRRLNTSTLHVSMDGETETVTATPIVVKKK